MSIITETLFIENYTQIIIRVCRAILLPLVVIICKNYARATPLKLLSAFSKILPVCPSASGIILTTLKNAPSIFDTLMGQQLGTLDKVSGKKNYSKKKKKNVKFILFQKIKKQPTENVLELSRAVHKLLRYCTIHNKSFISNLDWNWGSFYFLLNHPSEEVRWHTAKSIILFEKFNGKVIEKLQENICSDELDQKFTQFLFSFALFAFIFN